MFASDYDDDDDDDRILLAFGLSADEIMSIYCYPRASVSE